jgi:hypothetical protein
VHAIVHAIVLDLLQERCRRRLLPYLPL